MTGQDDNALCHFEGELALHARIGPVKELMCLACVVGRMLGGAKGRLIILGILAVINGVCTSMRAYTCGLCSVHFRATMMGYQTYNLDLRLSHRRQASKC